MNLPIGTVRAYVYRSHAENIDPGIAYVYYRYFDACVPGMGLVFRRVPHQAPSATSADTAYYEWKLKELSLR